MQTVLAVQERQLPTMADPNYANAHQEAVPVELRHFLHHGLQRGKGERFSSAIEVIVDLEHVRSGDFAVSCPVTFMKANNTRMERFMDRHPLGSLGLAAATALAFVGGVAGWFMWALG